MIVIMIVIMIMISLNITSYKEPRLKVHCNLVNVLVVNIYYEASNIPDGMMTNDAFFGLLL